MTASARGFAITAALVAMAVLLLTVPGGICLCDKGACADDGAGQSSGAPHDCSSGCALICCSQPVVIDTVIHPLLAASAPSAWLEAPPAVAVETTASAPHAPPPRA